MFPVRARPRFPRSSVVNGSALQRFPNPVSFHGGKLSLLDQQLIGETKNLGDKTTDPADGRRLSRIGLG